MKSGALPHFSFDHRKRRGLLTDCKLSVWTTLPQRNDLYYRERRTETERNSRDPDKGRSLTRERENARGQQRVERHGDDRQSAQSGAQPRQRSNGTNLGCDWLARPHRANDFTVGDTERSPYRRSANRPATGSRLPCWSPRLRSFQGSPPLGATRPGQGERRSSPPPEPVAYDRALDSLVAPSPLRGRSWRVSLYISHC